MTTQEVDPETFYGVGRRLFELAGDMYDAFQVNVSILGGTGSMAGTDDAGTAWAASYDQRVADLLGSVNDLTAAMENYGGVVIQAGFNHAMAEYHATPGSKGSPPVKPPEPSRETSALTAPPSAGGPGKGLVDTLGLADQVGIPVPDGDTDKVDVAAQAWDRLATVYQTTTVVEALEVNASRFDETKSGEVDYIAKDIRELRDATRTILDGCGELAQSCRDYKAALDELRGTLSGILDACAEELLTTVIIGFAASFLSAGFGAVAAAGKAAVTITKFAKRIAEAITTWKAYRNVSSGVEKLHDLAAVQRALQRLKSLGRRGHDESTTNGRPTKTPEEHRNDLGKDPATGQFRPGEADTGLRVEESRGITLERSPDAKGPDWIGSDGKSYDAVGNFPAEHFDKQWPNLQDRIRDHLGKADYVPVDVSQFTPQQTALVREYIKQFGDRVFVVGG